MWCVFLDVESDYGFLVDDYDCGILVNINVIVVSDAIYDLGWI